MPDGRALAPDFPDEAMNDGAVRVLAALTHPMLPLPEGEGWGEGEPGEYQPARPLPASPPVGTGHPACAA